MLNEALHGNELNVHWRPQSDICRPCAVKYDFIGRYDTLISEADYVLRQVTNPEHVIGGKRNATTRRTAGSRDEVVKFPRSDPDNQRKKSNFLVRVMMADLKRYDMLRLNKLYEYDYRLYGYKPKIF